MKTLIIFAISIDRAGTVFEILDPHKKGNLVLNDWITSFDGYRSDELHLVEEWKDILHMLPSMSDGDELQSILGQAQHWKKQADFLG